MSDTTEATDTTPEERANALANSTDTENELSTEVEGSEEQDGGEQSDEDMFPRKVVEELRQENGKYRQKAGNYAKRLHTELVRATGRLADPTDLPFDAAHLDDPEALTAAIDTLLEAKPHLESRRPTGDIGQGHKGEKTADFSLMDRLRSL